MKNSIPDLKKSFYNSRSLSSVSFIILLIEVCCCTKDPCTEVVWSPRARAEKDWQPRAGEVPPSVSCAGGTAVLC